MNQRILIKEAVPGAWVISASSTSTMGASAGRSSFATASLAFDHAHRTADQPSMQHAKTASGK